MPRRHRLLPRFGSLLQLGASGRKFRCLRLGFPRHGGIGLCPRDGWDRAGRTKEKSANEGVGWREFQRAGCPVPESGKVHAIVKPQLVVDGRQAAWRPWTTLSPQAKATVLKAVKESKARGAWGSHMGGKRTARAQANLSPSSGDMFGGVMALRHRAQEADQVERRRPAATGRP